MAARIATVLAAAWLVGSLFLAFVATQNFATVDRVLAAPPTEASRMIGTLGAEDSRLLLRYLAGEENRLYFQDWENAELALIAALAALCWWGMKSPLRTALATVALVITAVQHFAITPRLVDEGIAIAFSTAPDRLANFGKLHAVYGVVELLNLGLAVTTVWLLISEGRQRRNAADPGRLKEHASGAQSFLHQGQ